MASSHMWMHVYLKNWEIFQSHCFMLKGTRNENDERNFAFYCIQFGLNTDDIFSPILYNVRKSLCLQAIKMGCMQKFSHCFN